MRLTQRLREPFLSEDNVTSYGMGFRLRRDQRGKP